jgi:cyclopropane fatty-acyl-phospholipid synthase-like methyltransferase
MVAGLASAIGTSAQGLVGIASGMIGSGKRKREQRAAQAEYNTNKARFSNLDTSNVYANQQNMYEDSTVNQKEAEFTKQQQMQSQANIMGGMNQAAGGSGIAAMAQALANQSSADAQSASVSIGNQEAANQSNFQAAATNIQSQKLAGEQASREAEKDKTSTLLGMSQNRLGAANAARAAATSAIMGGVGTLAGGAEKFFGK